MSERPTFSVVLATRNRAQHLREALERLAGQQTQGAFTYEVLVVDNGSTDDTPQVVEEFVTRFPGSLRYLCEGTVGKSYALNTALRDAKGEFVAFTDDDILTTPTWLATLWRCFLEEKADGVGGPVAPRWMVPPPTWLPAEMAHRFCGLGLLDRGAQRLRSREGQHPGSWNGGNMAWRRSAIDRVGPFDVRLVRMEDAEYFKRCLCHRLNLVYEPAALVHHKLGAERLNARYLRRRRLVRGRERALYVPWTGVLPVTLMPLIWYRRMLHALGWWVVALVLRRPFAERFHQELVVLEDASFWFHRLLIRLVGSADEPSSTDETGPYRQPYRFTQDLFTSRIPLWQRVLSPFQGAANLRYLEIGVYEGRSALWMLEHVLTRSSSRMTAVDLFPHDLKKHFLANLRLSGFAKKVTVITGRSQTELRRLPLRHFDIIYVDGSHRAGDVFTDAVLSWELLKPGGLLMFDDYQWSERFSEELRPHVAIDAFLTVFRDSLDVVHRGYQVIVKKRQNP